MLSCDLFYFFFFKQKTAYEMRISDWSSDVCSSDLSISLANKVRGEGNETRFGIVFNRVQTTSEVSKMLMERIGQALPANVVPHTIPHREHMRSEEHTSELQSLMRTSYAVFCLKKKNYPNTNTTQHNDHHYKTL